jgi:hypothetical protein
MDAQTVLAQVPAQLAKTGWCQQSDIDGVGAMGFRGVLRLSDGTIRRNVRRLKLWRCVLRRRMLCLMFRVTWLSVSFSGRLMRSRVANKTVLIKNWKGSSSDVL